VQLLPLPPALTLYHTTTPWAFPATPEKNGKEGQRVTFLLFFADLAATPPPSFFWIPAEQQTRGRTFLLAFLKVRTSIFALDCIGVIFFFFLLFSCLFTPQRSENLPRFLRIWGFFLLVNFPFRNP